MWAAIGIFFIIALVAAGFIMGLYWFAIPVVLLAVLAYLAYAGSMRSDQDKVARVESGPQPGSERPEDTPGGPRHKSPGHAHSGQERMVP